MAQSSSNCKSRAYVPIKHDDRSFEERQRSIWNDKHGDSEKAFSQHVVKESNAERESPGSGPHSLWDSTSNNIWDDMHFRMDKRRKEWEAEVERMRRDFFKLRPSERLSAERDLGAKNTNGITGAIFGNHNNSDDMIDENGKENDKFRVSFDVSQFSADEINVRTQDDKLIVHAKHEESSGAKNISREFSRQIDIPKQVDPEKLQCTMSKDGILQVEAPVCSPTYEKIDNKNSKSSRFGQEDCNSSSFGISSPQENFTTQMPPIQAVGALGTSASFRTGPNLTEQDGVRRLKMTIEIGIDFKPEDVLVKTIDKKLQISAKHEERKEGRTTMREFSKELELPDNVDPDTVTASMTDDGKLVIEAPMCGHRKGTHQYTKQPDISLSFK